MCLLAAASETRLLSSCSHALPFPCRPRLGKFAAEIDFAIYLDDLIILQTVGRFFCSSDTIADADLLDSVSFNISFLSAEHPSWYPLVPANRSKIYLYDFFKAFLKAFRRQFQTFLSPTTFRQFRLLLTRELCNPQL